VRADNSHHLAAAARRRREQTLARAHEALRELESSGAAVTVAGIAAKAGVSRAWLYAETDLRHRLNALRHSTAPIPPATTEPSSHASLRARLALAHQRIRELTDDNHQLRDQIARLHGQLRTAKLGANAHVSDSVHDTNTPLTTPARSSG
jgi:small-conductance mechanosensitive channel